MRDEFFDDIYNGFLGGRYLPEFFQKFFHEHRRGWGDSCPKKGKIENENEYGVLSLLKEVSKGVARIINFGKVAPERMDAFKKKFSILFSQIFFS